MRVNTQNYPFEITPREMQVIALILEGSSSKEVAETLGIRKRTVDFHLSKIYEKLDVSNRIQLNKRFVQTGLIKYIEH